MPSIAHCSTKGLNDASLHLLLSWSAVAMRQSTEGYALKLPIIIRHGYFLPGMFGPKSSRIGRP